MQQQSSFAKRIKQISPTQHEFLMEDTLGTGLYLCCASCACFAKLPSLHTDMSHIKELPPPLDFNPNAPGRHDQPLFEDNCCGCCVGTCACCAACGRANRGGRNLICLLGLILIVFVLGVYLVTAPFAIFIVAFLEKSTLVELDDEKREIRMTTRGRFFRKQHVFATKTIQYDQIHDIYAQLVDESEFDMLLQTKDGNRVNFMHPIDIPSEEYKATEKYLRDFFGARGVLLVGEQSHSTSTHYNPTPQQHQMV